MRIENGGRRAAPRRTAPHLWTFCLEVVALPEKKNARLAYNQTSAESTKFDYKMYIVIPTWCETFLISRYLLLFVA